MFKNEKEEFINEPGGGTEDTIIGSTIKIEGDLASDGNIVVEGEVVGSLKTQKNLRITNSAKVTADVEAKEALIAGIVEGNITVEDKIELTESAKVTGDIKTNVLSIASGAKFNGKCEMGEGPKIVEKPFEQENNEAKNQEDKEVDDKTEEKE